MAAFGKMTISALAALSALMPHGVAGLALWREPSVSGFPLRQGEVDWESRPTGSSKSVLLDFDFGNLTHNNLGGVGPDSGEKSMIIKPVGKYGETLLGLRIEVAPGYNYTGRPESNKVYDGILSINVEAGVRTQFTAIVFDISSGAPVLLPHFYVSIFDIDAGSVTGDGEHPHKAAGVEIAAFSNISAYYMREDAQIKVQDSEYGKTFVANLTGTSADNPTSPHNLTEEQQLKTAMVEYKNASEFRLTVQVGSQDGEDDAGRNFLLAGKSDLVDSPFGPCMDANYLDLGKATVELNNLDGSIPGRHSQLRYKHAGVVNKVHIDLWVGVYSGDYTPTAPSRNGLRGHLGQINMGINNTVTFTFQLVNSETHTPVKVSDFFFSFFDIDQELFGSEALTLESGRGTYFLSNDTTLQTLYGGNGSITFQSTMYGSVANNPRMSQNADMDEAVTLYFADPVSSFRVTYETVSTAGRNFLFGGMTDAGCPPS